MADGEVNFADVQKRKDAGIPPTADEREYVLEAISYKLCLDEKRLEIERFSKKQVGGKLHYHLTLSDGSMITINGMRELRNQERVVDMLSEKLDVLLDRRIRSRCIAVTPKQELNWDSICNGLLLCVEDDDVSEHCAGNPNDVPEWQDPAIVQQWLEEYLQFSGLSRDIEKSFLNKQPALENEWIWFFPAHIVQDKGLQVGKQANEFYQTLKSLGITEKSKRLASGNIAKAYRVEWKKLSDDLQDPELFLTG